MKKLIATAALTLAAANVQAAPILGDSSLNSVSGMTATWEFDTVSAALDIVNADGLIFTAGGMTLTVTSVGSPSGAVIQDKPGNGGVGVDDGPKGDNMADGEALRFTFSDAIDLLTLDLNGTVGSDGHTSAASGTFTLTTNTGTVVSSADASAYSTGGMLPAGFSGITWFEVSTESLTAGGWHGYVDNITTTYVPEPGMLALLGLGLVGVAAARRKA